jgi:hypothetical protein
MVAINDKHIEVICRPMVRSVRVIVKEKNAPSCRPRRTQANALRKPLSTSGLPKRDDVWHYVNFIPNSREKER